MLCQTRSNNDQSWVGCRLKKRMSRFASPVEKYSQSHPKSKKEFLKPKSHNLPPPPPPPPLTDLENEETKSIASSISSRRSKSTNNGWINEKASLSVRPIDSGKTILLTKQLLNTLEEETVINDQPQSVLFPSRVYDKSEIIRRCRDDIVCIQSDWQRFAYQAIDEVQHLSLDIIQFREASEALSLQTSEKEAELAQKKVELDKLYSHLAILEKEASKRGLKWIRPPLIRSVVPTISPRNIALSIASEGANLGNSQPSDINWKLELSKLIDSTTSSRMRDDSSETKSEKNDSSHFQSVETNLPAASSQYSKPNTWEEYNDENNQRETANSSPTIRPLRPAPKAPVTRKSAFIDSEIHDFPASTPYHHEFLTIDDMKIPFDQWIEASIPADSRLNNRSTTPIKWKAEKLKLSALIPPPLPPPPPPPPMYRHVDVEKNCTNSSIEDEESEVSHSVSLRSEGSETSRDFGHLFGLGSQRHLSRTQVDLDDEEIDLIALSQNHQSHRFSSTEPQEPPESDEEEGQRFRYIPTEMSEEETDNHDRENFLDDEEEHQYSHHEYNEPDMPPSDPSVRDWYTGRKLSETKVTSSQTYTPNFDPSDTIDWENAKQNELDPYELYDEEEVMSSVCMVRDDLIGTVKGGTYRGKLQRRK